MSNAAAHEHWWGPWQRRRADQPWPEGGVRTCPCGALEQSLNIDEEPEAGSPGLRNQETT